MPRVRKFDGRVLSENIDPQAKEGWDLFSYCTCSVTLSEGSACVSMPNCVPVMRFPSCTMLPPAALQSTPDLALGLSSRLGPACSRMFLPQVAPTEASVLLTHALLPI